VREGCYNCHSQMIRPLRDEVERYGHYSLAAESMYDRPFQWGSKRTGPDLARVGGKYSDDWHRDHLRAPKSVVPGSIMPSYHWLESTEIDYTHIDDDLRVQAALGVPYTADELDAPSIAQFGRETRANYADACAMFDLDPAPRLTIEAGRSIAAPAGVTLYTVGTIKDIPGVRTYVAVDGGMSDNPRPATYGARYEAFLPARAAAARPATVTVAGKHCEQGDLLVRDAQLPADVAVGDVLATPVTGAYAHSMASNYNMLPRPAVVFVDRGRARLVVLRETYDDLVARDVVEEDAE